MKKLIITIAVLALTALGAFAQATLKSEIASLQSQIRDAEAEDAKYSGGLIKALIGSRQRRNEVLEAGRRLSCLKQSYKRVAIRVYDENGTVIGMHEALEQG